MTEFKKYVERRDRVEALRFLAFGQANEIAQALGAVEWKLYVTNGGWDFWMEAIPDAQPDIRQRVNRGDYVTRDGEVIPADEFRDKWEREV